MRQRLKCVERRLFLATDHLFVQHWDGDAYNVFYPRTAQGFADFISQYGTVMLTTVNRSSTPIPRHPLKCATPKCPHVATTYCKCSQKTALLAPLHCVQVFFLFCYWRCWHHYTVCWHHYTVCKCFSCSATPKFDLRAQELALGRYVCGKAMCRFCEASYADRTCDYDFRKLQQLVRFLSLCLTVPHFF